MLLELNMRVKIIEINRDTCDLLCSLLPKAEIICGDGTTEELLLEEGIEHTDAFIALTGIDEENIILSMYAATRTQGKVVAKVNRISFMDIITNSGIETVVSPKYITATQIHPLCPRAAQLHRLQHDRDAAPHCQQPGRSPRIPRGGTLPRDRQTAEGS